MSANDNLEPVELRICQLDDFPDQVFIAMKGQDPIYPAEQNEAIEIALDIMDKAVPRPEAELFVFERLRPATPEEEKELRETGRITGVAGWSAPAWTPLQEYRR